MKHTPREPGWYVDQHGFSVIEQLDNGVATVAMLRPHAKIRERARLIATAPKMLDCLKAIDTEGHDANSNGDVTIPSHIWDKIQETLLLTKRG